MLENLEKGELYEIRLGAVNSEGVSDPSDPTVIYVGVAGKAAFFAHHVRWFSNLINGISFVVVAEARLINTAC